MHYVVNVILACAIGWLFAALFWPWVGPLLLKPCPLFTQVGVIVVVVLFALSGGLLGRRWL